MNSKTLPVNKTLGLWIDGRHEPGRSGASFPTINPATEEHIVDICRANSDDVAAAVEAAARAFRNASWAALTSSQRRQCLLRAADGIERAAAELAELETADSGKPIRDSLSADIPAAAEAFRYFAGWTDKIAGETLLNDPSYFSYTLREPLGVIGIITPWNFPLAIAAQRTAAALAAGNTVVLKPAEQTSLTALKLAEILHAAGIPAGAFNVITGFGEEAGRALVRHPKVDAISFTGELQTGQEIMKDAIPGLKRLSFELGGKSPNIIFEDANLEKAVDFACSGIFFNQGEICCAGSRVLVQKSIEREFLRLLESKSKDWKPADPMDMATRMGAVISLEQLDKIHRYIKAGEEQGARLIVDGRREKGKGFFIGPTIFSEVTQAMTIAREEIFGPVLAVSVFEGEHDALAKANDTFYGLAAAVWTKDLSRAHRLSRGLKAGTIWVNCFDVGSPALPFGGYKMSGSGREGGSAAFEFYTQVKTVWINLE